MCACGCYEEEGAGSLGFAGAAVGSPAVKSAKSARGIRPFRQERAAAHQVLPDAPALARLHPATASADRRVMLGRPESLLRGQAPQAVLQQRERVFRAACTDNVGAAALLIRPDGYVCWAADSSAACGDTLLAAIAGNLAKP